MQDPYTSLSRLGWMLHELGSSVVRDVEFTRAARLFLDQLASATGDSIRLGILDSDAVLYLDRGESSSGLRMVANAGRCGPRHATASGKLLLTFAADAELVERLLGKPLATLTQSTFTDPAALRRQLSTVRTRGYAVCRQEREIGSCSLAAPLLNYTGTVGGSLALASPAQRLTKSSLPGCLKELQTAAHNIEVRIGGLRPAANADFASVQAD